ncbi:MAG: hypothetical protein ACRDPE_16835, partial [Solirubrobacterales bacterium]
MSGRNPDLPILDELRVEFEALVETAGGTQGTPAPAAGERRDDHAVRRRAPLPAPRRSRERGAQ